jgi:hypothetical protein
MPLQDHFHPPLSSRRHGTSFHNAWATFIASALNEHLPEGYFAEANVKFGIEIDVATFEEYQAKEELGRSWQPPQPTATLPLILNTDLVEIAVFSQEGGPTLAGAVELVSPANKDREESRQAFVSKCASYLQEGIGLAVVDVVTDRRANMHGLLLAKVSPVAMEASAGELYAAAYRPILRDKAPAVDVWYDELHIGHTLPTLPIWLRGGLHIPLDLEAAYERTCREHRLRLNGPQK